jgi:hypothetical protein
MGAEGTNTTPAEAAAASTSPPWPIDVIWSEWPDLEPSATAPADTPGPGAAPATWPLPFQRPADGDGEGQSKGRRARQAQQLLDRVAGQVGEPVVAAVPATAEGAFGCVYLGLAVGVGLLQGALGALIGIVVGWGVARLVTRHRAVGLSCRVVLVATSDAVRAIKSTWWCGRPTGEILAVWPVGVMRAEVRRKLCTVALRLVGPDGRALRLETWGRRTLPMCEALAAHLTGPSSSQ